MKAGIALALGGLLMAFGGVSHAQTQHTQPQAHNPEAAPSDLPASQADVNAVTGPNLKVNPSQVGSHPTPPSPKPAKKETVEAVKQKP